MIYKEEVRDLFTVPQGYMLAHCISEDFNLGGGIAKQFCECYNMREKLFNEYDLSFYDNDYVGDALVIENVYNLVTKKYVHDRPTYENLIKALKAMKKDMDLNLQKKVAMPRIGCGLDGLNWDIVRSIIRSVFEDTDVEILICIREEDLSKDSESVNYEDFDIGKCDCGCDCSDCRDYQLSNPILEGKWEDKDLLSIYKAISQELEKRHINNT